MGVAFVFPGQGSQAIGMGKELFDGSPAARAVFEEVDAALDQDLSGLMFAGEDETLRLTENAQPALMTVSAAVLAAMAERGFMMGEHVAYVAGHSLGEYAALHAAGSLPLAKTAQLLKLRGQAMQRAVPVGEGAMAAVLGLDLETVHQIAKDAGQVGVCAVANDNSPGQVVISGATAAIDRAIELAKEAGAKRALPLPVSAPFHCPLMAPAAEEMAAALADVSFESPAVPVVANVTAAPETDPDKLKGRLVEQVTGVVRWRESVSALAGLGVTKTVEIGAGKVLSGLTKRIDRSIEAVSLQNIADIDAYLAG